MSKHQVSTYAARLKVFRYYPHVILQATSNNLYNLWDPQACPVHSRVRPVPIHPTTKTAPGSPTTSSSLAYALITCTTRLREMEQPYVASQQVELRVQKIPDLVIVLAEGALDDNLLRPCAALQYISSHHKRKTLFGCHIVPTNCIFRIQRAKSRFRKKKKKIQKTT